MNKLIIKINQWARRMRYTIRKDTRHGGMVADLMRDSIKLLFIIALLLMVASQEFDTISRIK